MEDKSGRSLENLFDDSSNLDHAEQTQAASEINRKVSTAVTESPTIKKTQIVNKK